MLPEIHKLENGQTGPSPSLFDVFGLEMRPLAEIKMVGLAKTSASWVIGFAIRIQFCRLSTGPRRECTELDIPHRTVRTS